MKTVRGPVNARSSTSSYKPKKTAQKMKPSTLTAITGTGYVSSLTKEMAPEEETANRPRNRTRPISVLKAPTTTYRQIFALKAKSLLTRVQHGGLWTSCSLVGVRSCSTRSLHPSSSSSRGICGSHGSSHSPEVQDPGGSSSGNAADGGAVPAMNG